MRRSTKTSAKGRSITYERRITSLNTMLVSYAEMRARADALNNEVELFLREIAKVAIKLLEAREPR